MEIKTKYYRIMCNETGTESAKQIEKDTDNLKKDMVDKKLIKIKTRAIGGTGLMVFYHFK